MTYIAAELVIVAIACLAFALMLWHYRLTVSRKVQMADFQYELFALRDRAIRLVIDGKSQEDDRSWKYVYSLINGAARKSTVQTLNGYRFVLSLLRASPTDKIILEVDPRSMTAELRELLAATLGTMIGICYRGSFLFRSFLWLSSKTRAIKSLVERKHPLEVKTLREWKRVKNQVERAQPEVCAAS